LTDADLGNADLTDADLYRADLSGADLRGADLRDADLHGVHIPQIITAGPAGSTNRTTYYNLVNDEIRNGVFFGPLAEFAEEVEKVYANNPLYLAEYRAMVKFFEAVKEARA
jgi:uncharacterized protein YjbI with pentapeptide repeats